MDRRRREETAGTADHASGVSEPNILSLRVVLLDLFEVAAERLRAGDLVPGHAAEMLADARRDQLVGLKDVQRVLSKDVDRLPGLLLGIAQHAPAILPGYGTKEKRRDEQRGGNQQAIRPGACQIPLRRILDQRPGETVRHKRFQIRPSGTTRKASNSPLRASQDLR